MEVFGKRSKTTSLNNWLSFLSPHHLKLTAEKELIKYKFIRSSKRHLGLPFQNLQILLKGSFILSVEIRYFWAILARFDPRAAGRLRALLPVRSLASI